MIMTLVHALISFILGIYHVNHITLHHVNSFSPILGLTQRGFLLFVPGCANFSHSGRGLLIILTEYRSHIKDSNIN